LEQLKKRRRHIYTVFKAKEFVSPDKKWGTYAQADDHSKREEIQKIKSASNNIHKDHTLIYTTRNSSPHKLDK